MSPLLQVVGAQPIDKELDDLMQTRARSVSAGSASGGGRSPRAPATDAASEHRIRLRLYDLNWEGGVAYDMTVDEVRWSSLSNKLPSSDA